MDLSVPDREKGVIRHCVPPPTPGTVKPWPEKRSTVSWVHPVSTGVESRWEVFAESTRLPSASSR